MDGIVRILEFGVHSWSEIQYGPEFDVHACMTCP
jgi:hypothetical protein